MLVFGLKLPVPRRDGFDRVSHEEHDTLHSVMLYEATASVCLQVGWVATNHDFAPDIPIGWRYRGNHEEMQLGVTPLHRGCSAEHMQAQPLRSSTLTNFAIG